MRARLRPSRCRAPRAERRSAGERSLALASPASSCPLHGRPALGLPLAAPPSRFGRGLRSPRWGRSYGYRQGASAECESGTCVPLTGAPLGGETRGVCTQICVTDAGCVPGWACTPVPGGASVCGCQPSNESCDGKDNDCNGVVDPGGTNRTCALDEQCHTVDMLWSSGDAIVSAVAFGATDSVVRSGHLGVLSLASMIEARLRDAEGEPVEQSHRRDLRVRRCQMCRRQAAARLGSIPRLALAPRGWPRTRPMSTSPPRPPASRSNASASESVRRAAS